MASYCEKCGKRINDNVSFCKYCGARINSEQKAEGINYNPEEDNERHSYNTNHKQWFSFNIICVVATILLVVAMIGIIFYFITSKDSKERLLESVDNAEQNKSNDSAVPEHAVDYLIPSDFDVASNMVITEEGDVKTIETDHVIITAPRGSSWDCQLSRYKDGHEIVNSFYIYNKDAKIDGYRGEIVAISVCNPDDNYKDWGVDVIGEKDGKIIYASYFLAGAAQCDPDNEQSEEDYDAVLRGVTFKLKKGDEIQEITPEYLEKYYRPY